MRFTVSEGADTTVTEYTFEGHNRRTEIVTENSTVMRSLAYHYDETDRLASIDDDTDPGNPTTTTITYACDNNGNMISKSDSASAPAGERDDSRRV